MKHSNYIQKLESLKALRNLLTESKEKFENITQEKAKSLLLWLISEINSQIVEESEILEEVKMQREFNSRKYWEDVVVKKARHFRHPGKRWKEKALENGDWWYRETEKLKREKSLLNYHYSDYVEDDVYAEDCVSECITKVYLAKSKSSNNFYNTYCDHGRVKSCTYTTTTIKKKYKFFKKSA